MCTVPFYSIKLTGIRRSKKIPFVNNIDTNTVIYTKMNLSMTVTTCREALKPPQCFTSVLVNMHHFKMSWLHSSEKVLTPVGFLVFAFVKVSGRTSEFTSNWTSLEEKGEGERGRRKRMKKNFLCFHLFTYCLKFLLLNTVILKCRQWYVVPKRLMNSPLRYIREFFPPIIFWESSKHNPLYQSHYHLQFYM